MSPLPTTSYCLGSSNIISPESKTLVLSPLLKESLLQALSDLCALSWGPPSDWEEEPHFLPSAPCRSWAQPQLGLQQVGFVQGRWEEGQGCTCFRMSSTGPPVSRGWRERPLPAGLWPEQEERKYLLLLTCLSLCLLLDPLFFWHLQWRPIYSFSSFSM